MRRKKKSKLRMKRVFLFLAACMAAAALCLGVKVYSEVGSTTKAIHKSIKQSDKRKGKVDVNEKHPFSVLLAGVDERKGDTGRSDSLIVVTVNPEKNTTKMLSIPRDTRTEIIGHHTVDKINHAYAFGGIQMTIDSVENLLDIPIDYYVQVNMQGFKDIVDSVGGVTVSNDFEFTYKGVHFAKGTIFLTGYDALIYTRMRHEDPRGDFGRQLRQRKVIKAIVSEGTKVHTLTHYDEIMNAIKGNIKTNLTLNEMLEIQKNYKDAARSIQELQLHGETQKIEGLDYQIVSPRERDEVSSVLRGHLQMKH
ncbi:LCP family protein [Peribacillus sp. B-H-3]|uniref:LCP family glycopolymer transferase n=1 Tax=Peribacillus sp. B-H-3 TaxID=3400420 RepID=UPI003B029163